MITLSHGSCSCRHAAKTIPGDPIFIPVASFRILFVCCLLACFYRPASGQDTLYYDQHFDPVLDPAAAQFIQVRNCDPRDSIRCVVMTFNAQRGLIAVMKYANYAEHILHGRCSYWYETGRLCQEENFRNGKKQGIETVYYPGGQLKRKIVWDNDTIVSGSFFNEDGSPRTEVFQEELWKSEEWQSPPKFPGGGDSLLYYLSASINYPHVARENNVQGIVTVSFVVDRGGKISDVRIVESVSPEIDKEAIRVFQKMPRWEPGRINGIPIRVRFTMSVHFRLE